MTQSHTSGPLDKHQLGHDVDRSAPAPSASDPPNPCIPSDAAIEHFDVLLGAVAARLKTAADEASAEAIATNADAVLARLCETVLDCVEALHQLQTTQRYLRGLRHGSEMRIET